LKIRKKASELVQLYLTNLLLANAEQVKKLEQDKKKEEEELRKFRLKAQIEAEEKLKAEAKIKAETEEKLKADAKIKTVTSKKINNDNKNANEYTHEKLSKYTVTSLKNICTEYDLPKHGLKDDIIARIIKYVNNG